MYILSVYWTIGAEFYGFDFKYYQNNCPFSTKVIYICLKSLWTEENANSIFVYIYIGFSFFPF